MTQPTLRYQLGRIDLLDWLVSYIVRSPFLWAVAVGLSGYRCWTLFRDGLAQSVPLLAFHGSLTFFGIWAAFLVIIPLLTFLRPQPALGIEVVFQAHQDHFTTESQLARNEVRWSTIRRIRNGWGHLFLCISANQAVIIPFRCFTQPADREAFVRLCRERIQSASARPSATSTPSS
jgi:hypothetical protein